jgi:putative addiction module CopG family antidote
MTKSDQLLQRLGSVSVTIDLPSDLEKFVKQVVASGSFGSAEEVIRKALQLLQAQEPNFKSESPQCRQGGQWKGRLHIAEDFDELPHDIAEAFGIRDA